MNTCRSCHQDIHETFIHTGMGRSFDHATLEKTQASFGDHALIYDETSNFYYFPFFKDSTMFVTEFRLENGDTIHKRTERIEYIVGSGQHTNSHILNFNGYVFQAPITYYTQEEKWDMAPGFRDGGNLRFSRYLTTECITCHNHLPNFVEGSFNKYEEMPHGIECERCHGPGEIHVREMLAGNTVDTSLNIDYSIVNPGKLSRDLQMDLCQRCHLQGVAVLEEGKTFFDFKPGMRLNEVMNVFLPRYSNSHENFIMASQADRLRMSECFKQSEMTCITCHNPHESVETTGEKHFNDACLSCHKSSTACAASEADRLAEENNCSKCHMSKSGSIDIPHVNITDHYISKGNTLQKEKTEVTEGNPIFLGLDIMTKNRGTPLEMAKGYIAIFDKYVESLVMLDSAKYYLNLSELSFEEKFKTSVHLNFAAKTYQNIIQEAKQFPEENIKDAWTAYRIGQAFQYHSDSENALKYYLKAVSFMPLNLEFQEKLASAYFDSKLMTKARMTYEYVLKENEKRPVSLCNLGYIYALQGEYAKAESFYDKAIALNPDYEQALINKAAMLLLKTDNRAAKRMLNRVLKINPQNVQAQQAMNQLNL